MRDILFLAHRLPWPPDRGDRIRSYHVLQHLAKQARVHVMGFVDTPQELAEVEALRPMVASLHVETRMTSHVRGASAALLTGRPFSLVMFDSTSMHRMILRCLEENEIGTIYAFSGQMAQFVPPTTGARFLMDFVDVDSEKFRTYSKLSGPHLNWICRREARLFAGFESAIARRADYSLFVSEAEAALFRTRDDVPGDRVLAIENGVDLDYWRPNPAIKPAVDKSSPLLVFTGQMNYPPNAIAVTRFATHILPVVRSTRPDVRFAIVGREPTVAVRALAELPGVIVTGEVADVRPWLVAADLVVAPLTIARGVQNKVLEAMAMARAVIASPEAAEGISARPERDFIVAGEEGMALAIRALLELPERAAAIGKRARAQMEEHYPWDTRLAALTPLLAE